MSSINVQTTVKKTPGRTYAIIALLILALSGLLAYTLNYGVALDNTLVEKARENALQTTKTAAEDMDDIFQWLEKIADGKARKLEGKHYSKQEMEDLVYSVLEQKQEVFGFSIAYKPYKYDRETKLYAPYCYRKNGAIKRTHVEDFYDYTQEDMEGRNWYISPLQQGLQPGEGCWSEPYLDTVSDRRLSVYSVPFSGVDPVTGKSEIVGVVSIAYSLDDMEKFVKTLSLGWGGYAYLISKEGTYMYHPIQERVFTQCTSGSYSDDVDQELVQKLLANNGTVYDFNNELTGQEALVLHQRIRSTGYELGAIFIKDPNINNKSLTRHKFIIVSVLVVSILALLSIFLTKSYRSFEKRLWGISLFISALLVLGITTVWFISTKYNTYSDNDLVIVKDQVSVQSVVNEESKKLSSEPILIPTGVSILTLEFENANNVKLTGYVWQIYNKDMGIEIPEDSPGITFPEAIAASVDMYEAYRKITQDGQTIIGWHFDANLRQEFDYSKYPLDTKDVWLRLWPKEFDKNVILVPDFSSYPSVNPDDKPGVATDIVLSGWATKQSFFCYDIKNSYNTNFGIRNYTERDQFPELAFMVLIMRNFMNPFISYLLPFVVMAFMLFGTLALIYIIESKARKFDFSAAGVLAACTGLFFSVVVTHNGLRERITVNGILYLEYFYFVLYAAIILVIIDAFMVAFKSQSRFVQYKDNLIPKILYWPSMLAVILGITIRLFY